jgi:hypothetical protein
MVLADELRDTIRRWLLKLASQGTKNRAKLGTFWWAGPYSFVLWNQGGFGRSIDAA